MTETAEKFKIQQYISSAGFATASFIAAGCYLENFYWPELGGGFPFVPGDDGVYSIRYPAWGPPDAPMAFTAIADDFGDFVHGMLLDVGAWNGKTVMANSALLSRTELIEGFEKCRFLSC